MDKIQNCITFKSIKSLTSFQKRKKKIFELSKILQDSDQPHPLHKIPRNTHTHTRYSNETTWNRKFVTQNSMQRSKSDSKATFNFQH